MKLKNIFLLLLLYIHVVASRCCSSTVVLFTSHSVGLFFFTSNIHRCRRIDPRLAFHLESLTFSMEDDLRQLLHCTPWQRLLLW